MLKSTLLAPCKMSSKAKRSQNGCHSQSMLPPASTLVEFSPPSTPSRLSPSSVPLLYTSSPSNTPSPMYATPSKPQPFCEDDTGNEQFSSEQNSKQFDMSSTCPSHGSCVPMPTTPKATVPRASVESVSLEQHMRHSDIGREEAMQSFILERFLPAAKAVATDHDHTLYTASKHHSMKPSMTSHMSMSRSTKSTARLYSIPSTLSASKGVTWSSPLSRDDGEMESLDGDEPTKSSGFFCVGLKTAISRVHKVVHPSAHSMSRSKSRAAPSFSKEASCEEEEDVLPKVNVSLQGMQRRRNADTTASYTFSSSSPTIETIPRGRLSSYPPSSRNSFSRSGHVGQDGSPFVSRTSLDATPLHNRSASCHSISPSIQELRCNCFKQSSLRGNGWECSLRPPCDQSCANCYREHAENSVGGTRLKDYHLQNTSKCTPSDVSVQVPANRAISKGSTAHHDPLEGSSRDPDFSEDDEHEFYDAFDSWSSMPGDVTPLPCTSPTSPKISGSSRKWTSDEDGVVDVPNHTKTPHVFNLSCKTSGCHANHDNSKYFLEKQEIHCSSCGGGAAAGSAHIAPVNQKHGKTQADQGKESLSRTMNNTFSPNSDSLCKSGTPNGHKKWFTSPKPGWPLGISGFQSGAEKSSFQEQANQDDRFTTNSVSAFTESNVSSPRVPPSPTGSWLERAMALNASKPSTLATLQQKEKAVSARKKLEFPLSDTKRDVKWEDVVKGSQMHPEHFRFSEELRHRHPCNRNAIKPLRL